MTEAPVESTSATTGQLPEKADSVAAAPPPAMPFYIDTDGVPLTGNEIIDGCIRGQVPVGSDGQPFACNRYHDGYVWNTGTMTFVWNTRLDPPLLQLPDGYEAVTRPVEVPEQSDTESGSGELATDDTGISADEHADPPDSLPATDGAAESVITDSLPAVGNTPETGPEVMPAVQ